MLVLTWKVSILKKWEEQEAANVCMVGAGKTNLIGGIPMHSTFDACITGSLIPVEIKTHFGFKDMDELCELYAPQCQHHMLVAGNNLCYIVALFGVRCRLEWRLIKADHNWMDDYLEQCKKFWDMYQNQTEQTPLALPPVEYSDMFVMNMRDLPDWSEEVDATYRMVSKAIIDAKESVALSDEAKKAFKSRMPREMPAYGLRAYWQPQRPQDSCHTFSCWHTDMYTHCTKGEE